MCSLTGGGKNIGIHLILSDVCTFQAIVDWVTLGNRTNVMIVYQFRNLQRTLQLGILSPESL